MTMVFFVSAMKLETALDTYLADLKATAIAVSHDLSGAVGGA